MKVPISGLFQGPARSGKYEIRCLVPDLPPVSDLLPYLERIEQNRWYSNFGPLVFEYEQRLSEMVGASCVTLSSGTAALELGIAALELPPGSRVMVPAFAFPAPVLAVLRCGLTPVFCDVCPETWTLTHEIALDVLRYTDCSLVVPIATFGHALPCGEWDRFHEKTRIPVLIDAAPALGRQTLGEHVHAAFSLHATKPLGVGEGGVFATPDGDLAERVRRTTNYGMAQGVVARAGGTNAKLSEYGAAIGHAQLDRWPELVERRNSIWRRYSETLEQIPGVRVQAGFGDSAPSLLCVALPADAAPAIAALGAAGIETRRWYLPPLYEHPVFASFERCGPGGRNRLPVTEEIAIRQIGLPFHTHLSYADVVRVTEALSGAVGAAPQV